ncbi:MAG: PIN domain-containing protein [Chloroflexota bacterium]
MDGAALYDANVLYPASLRDLLLRLGVAGLVTPRWTDEILDEMFEALLAKHTHLDQKDLARTRTLMCRAIRDCLIGGYQHLVPQLTLPDPDDRHVLAAAIHAGVDTIVTMNLKDFPATALAPHGVSATDPDSFILELVEELPEAVLEVLIGQAAALRKPAQTVPQLMDRLERNGLKRSMHALRAAQ